MVVFHQFWKKPKYLVFGPENFPKLAFYHITLKLRSLDHLECFDFDNFHFFTFRSLFFTKVAISQNNVEFFLRKTKSGRGLKFATDHLCIAILNIVHGFGNRSFGF